MEVEEGNFGVYAVDNNKYDNYYMVMWDGEAAETEKDKMIELQR